MAIPEHFRIRITDPAGRAVPHALAIVTLRMPRKNDHSVWVGPSDNRGYIVVEREVLFREARKEADFFIMDYADPTEATGEFVVTAASPDSIEAAIKTYGDFSPHYPYREGWVADLNAAREAVREANGVVASLEGT